MNNRKTLSLKFPQKHAAKGWSHQHELNDLIGKQIQIGFDGKVVVGQLLAADQFTLKVKADGASSAVVMFKSALTSFGASLNG